jgi:ABC-type sugar transport system ATPase subunit
MNILDGRIERRGDKLLFSSERISLDVSLRKNLEEYAGKTVTAGIRPESLLPGNGPLTGKVELIEHLGSEIILHARIDEKTIIARLSPDIDKREGDDISLSLAGKGVHFFFMGERIQ